MKETVPGKERLIAKLLKGPALTQADFGDPVSGSTVYDVCIYDDTGALAGQLQVDRAGELCAGKECFRSLGPKGYSYEDKDTSADGVQMIQTQDDVTVKQSPDFHWKKPERMGYIRPWKSHLGVESGQVRASKFSGGPRCRESHRT